MTSPERGDGRTRKKAVGAIVALVLVALAVIAHVARGGMAHHGLSGAHSTRESAPGGGT